MDCVERYEEKMRRMRGAVRENARRLREEYGMPMVSPSRDGEERERERRNRCAHMDVDVRR